MDQWAKNRERKDRLHLSDLASQNEALRTAEAEAMALVISHEGRIAQLEEENAKLRQRLSELSAELDERLEEMKHQRDECRDMLNDVDSTLN